MKRSGGCLCGAIRYEVDGPMRPVVACHCEQCRRTSGHHVAATAARLADIRIFGTPTWFASSPGHTRGFCGICGSNLFWRDEAAEIISIFAGTLDQPTGLRLERHIHTHAKGDYYEIADGLPQLGEEAESRTTAEDRN